MSLCSLMLMEVMSESNANGIGSMADELSGQCNGDGVDVNVPKPKLISSCG